MVPVQTRMHPTTLVRLNFQIKNISIYILNTTKKQILNISCRNTIAHVVECQQQLVIVTAERLVGRFDYPHDQQPMPV